MDISTKKQVAVSKVAWENEFDARSPEAWTLALDDLMSGLPRQIRNQVARMCVGGTSSTVLLADRRSGSVTRGSRFYDWNVAEDGDDELAEQVAALINNAAPPGHPVRAPTSTLSKVLCWALEEPFHTDEVIAHQADFVAARLRNGGLPLTDELNEYVSDWHNALKLGFDISELRYPDWLTGGSQADESCSKISRILSEDFVSRGTHRRNKRSRLPRVVSPGDSTGIISDAAHKRWSLPQNCQMVAGTSDSIAAFLATGANDVGTAVTSLGSTLVIKMLSEARVDDSDRGVYSHRLGNRWLVGGASNVGCAVLRKEGFTNDELRSLEDALDPRVDTGYAYYPLVTPGERFPENDPKKMPVLDPKPNTRAEYLQAILEGISRVEANGYHSLRELGASPLQQVLTCGGGASNDPWMTLRERYLGVPVTTAQSTEASYGLALLAIEKLN